MSSKIIRLESLSLMDHVDSLNDSSVFHTTRLIEVGHPYDENWAESAPGGDGYVYRHSDRDVVSIDSIRSLCDSDGCCYLVKLKGGNELHLPIHAFIAETKEVTDDGND